MKKSLSVILSSAMALSMFSSMAFAKTSEDFTDLKDLDAATKAKFDALISAGIFDGVSDTVFGLKDPMNRAQFAKVAALVFGLKVDSTLTTSSFKDVKADDKANGYALPYIEALKAANLTDGYAPGEYNPAGQVTREQLATFLLRALGKDAEAKATPGVSDKTVSTWAKGYVALALQLKLIDNQTDGSFGGTNVANRELLVLAGYQAKLEYEKINVPDKASVSEAKAVGAFKVEVKLNKAVDTAKAKIALTKGSQVIGTSTTAPKWSDDKKSVVLTTDQKVTAGDYTVTLSGLEATEIDKDNVTFTAQDEHVDKLDFVSTSETIAYSVNAVIKLKASNQYGEAASFGTSSYTALVSGQNTSLTKDSDGNLVITADITKIGGVTQGNGVVPVTVYLNNSNTTISQNFKVGTVPILSKIEAQAPVYSNNGTALAAVGDTASIPLKLYDQYGNSIVRKQFDSGPVVNNVQQYELSISSINPVISPYEQKLEIVKAGQTAVTSDYFDDEDNARIKVRLNAKLDKTTDYTVNIYGGTSNAATATISVSASNLATKVDFGTSPVIAAGDSSAIIPIIATDANGKTLTAQEIVDNTSRFTFSVTNGNTSIITTGADKGKLLLSFPTPANIVAGSSIYVSGQINQSITNTYVSRPIKIDDRRQPDRITVPTEAASKAILGAGDKIQFQLKDQFNGDVGNVPQTIQNGNGQVSEYKVKVTVSITGNGVTVLPVNAHTADQGSTANSTTYTYDYNQLADFNAGFNVATTSGQEGKATIKAVILKATNGSNNFSELSSGITRSLEAIKSDTALTFSLGAIGTLFATDKLTGFTTEKNPVAGNPFARELSVTAKDSAGNSVKLPNNRISSVSSLPSAIALTGSVTNSGFVVGKSAGTATVSAVVYTNTGSTVNLTQEVTIKDETITVASIAGDKTNVALGSNTYAYQLFTNLTVKDQYGNAYTGDDIFTKYDSLLGIRYTVSVLQGTGAVSINAATGQITNVPTTVDEFIITAVAPNGKTAQVVVSN